MRELTSHLSFVVDTWTQSVVGRNLSVEEMNFALRTFAKIKTRREFLGKPDKKMKLVVKGDFG
jgi:hypothetical protein